MLQINLLFINRKYLYKNSHTCNYIYLYIVFHVHILYISIYIHNYIQTWAPWYSITLINLKKINSMTSIDLVNFSTVSINIISKHPLRLNIVFYSHTRFFFCWINIWGVWERRYINLLLLKNFLYKVSNSQLYKMWSSIVLHEYTL